MTIVMFDIFHSRVEHDSTNIMDSPPSAETPADPLPKRKQRTGNWHKFRLLMWKNWLLQWRHKLQMLVEILVPVVFSALLVLIRSMVDPEAIADVTRYEPLRVDSLEPLR